MKKSLILTLMVVSLQLLSNPSFADTYYVPDDYSTIQNAINGVTNGDIIIVRDGIWQGAGNRDLDFSGKAITLRSENGPEYCTIDCQNYGRGFSFNNGETSSSVLDGFSIINGYTSPVDSGGGIRCLNSSSPTIKNCIIRNNYGHDAGGIICIGSSAPAITDCIIVNNSAGNNAGGIYCYGSAPEISNCVVANNSAGVYGGGINCFEAGASPIITNCTITNNSAGQGGGIFVAGWMSGTASPTMINCILWNNSGGEIALRYLEYPSSLDVSYSDVKGGQAAAYINPGSTLNWGSGNIDSEPLLDGYHLTAGSPCIDTGTDAGVYHDIDGDIRPQGAGFDMGADERIAQTPEEEIEVVIYQISDILNSPPPELTPEAQDALDEALVWLVGNTKGNSQNGTLDKLASGDLEAALNKIRQAIDALNDASAASADTGDMQQTLAEAARDLASATLSEVEQVLIDAGLDPTLNSDFLDAQSFFEDGASLILAEQYYDAVSAFIQAVGSANQALLVLP